MAPRGRRSEAAEPQAYHELGVRGRKTGVSLPDRGHRDEHGMQPLEDLFSSPTKAAAAPVDDDQGESGSEDMELESSAGPGPRTILKNQKHMHYPLPRSRSPMKTNLRSPARKNPQLDRLSSPTRGSGTEDRDATVTRKLDFASAKPAARKPAVNKKPNGINGRSRYFEEAVEEEEEDEEGDYDQDFGPAGSDDDDGPDLADVMDESMQMVEAMGDDPVEEYEEEEEEEEEPLVRRQASEKRSRGRPKSTTKTRPRQPSKELPVHDGDDNSLPEPEPDHYGDEEEEELPEPEPVRKQRGRPSKKNQNPGTQGTAGASKKRLPIQDSNVEDGRDDPEQSPRLRKRPRTETTTAAQASPKRAKAGRPAKVNKSAAASKTGTGRPRGRPPRKEANPDAADAGEASLLQLQRGPPIPKSRGLVSVRRDANQMAQTRSGRHSYRPVDFWRGEEAIVGEEEQDDKFYNDHGFVLPTIKEVVRVPQDTAPSKRAPRSKTRNKTKAKARSEVVEEDEELEEWETNPGTVAGEVVMWEPEHELQPPAEDEPVNIMEEQVAISADAVQTKDVRDATFRFAKTLTMPFMGAGVVDLPPGAEKRPKNSRKMHMVFFVHYGKVMVTLNETQFRISAGGMWFVPRGNYYSISNDYDNPARVFFTQGCEVASQLGAMPEQSVLSTAP